MKTTDKPLTERQREIYEWVRAKCATGVPPTLREIGHAFGIRSTNGVSDHLNSIEARGLIIRDPMASRSIRIIGDQRPSDPPPPTPNNIPDLLHVRGKLLGVLEGKTPLAAAPEVLAEALGIVDRMLERNSRERERGAA